MALRDLNRPAQRLVKALRSGKYKQTKDTLTYNGMYCCLGVGCAIQTKVPMEIWQQERTLVGVASPIRQSLRFTTSEGGFKRGSFKKYPDCRNLADANDRYNASFKEIGDFIATNPPGLFLPKVKRVKKA